MMQRRIAMKPRTMFAMLAVAFATLAAGRAQAQLPDPGLTVDRSNPALVLSDAQNDFLSPTGVTWGLVGKSVPANHTVENIESLLKTAKQTEFLVFVSPHYYYPTDHDWKFGGAVETMMHGIHSSIARVRRPSRGSAAQAPTGSSATSRISTTATPWWPALIRSTDHRPTISRCSFASGESAR